MFREGEIVGVSIFGIWHEGIATGYGTFISGSYRIGRVTEENEKDFSGGRRIISKGYPSNLSSYAVMTRARQSIGKKWGFLNYNCQHFARECHDQKHSPQLQQGLLALGIVGLVFFLRRGKVA